MFGRREMINGPSEEFSGVTLPDEEEREAPVRTEPHPTFAFPGWNAERRTPNAKRQTPNATYDGGMTAILIPFRAQACSSTFAQSSSANSSVTISLTLILPLSR